MAISFVPLPLAIEIWHAEVVFWQIPEGLESFSLQYHFESEH
jgi:hypothetical protein